MRLSCNLWLQYEEEVQAWVGVVCRYSLTDWALNRWLLSGRDAGAAAYSGVRRQLDVLGDEHVGYGAKQFHAASGAKFSIVGGRPFSKVISHARLSII